MAGTQDAASQLEDLTISDLEKAIAQAILFHLGKAESRTIDPSDLRKSVSLMTSSHMDDAYGPMSKPETHKMFHHHWVTVIGRMMSAGEIELSGSLFLTHGRGVPLAA